VRYWTEGEAREYLPRVKELLQQLRTASAVAAASRGNGHGPKDGSVPDPRVAFAEFEERDIIVRDLQAGLIDFPAMGADGVVYYLCWRSDDDDLGFWHLPEEGFPGRKRLPREPA
jgi:hypothetical protein